MPYVHDVVRLATSAVLAGATGITRQGICEAILGGYQRGLKEPRPIVLDREYEELRRVAVVSESERKDFWRKFDPAEIEAERKKREKKGDESGRRYAPRMRCGIATARRWRPAGPIAARCSTTTSAPPAPAVSGGAAISVSAHGAAIWSCARRRRSFPPAGRSRMAASRRLRCAEIATGRYPFARPLLRAGRQRAAAQAVAERLQDRGGAEGRQGEGKGQEGRDPQAGGSQSAGGCRGAGSDGARPRVDSSRHAAASQGDFSLISRDVTPDGCTQPSRQRRARSKRISRRGRPIRQETETPEGREDEAAMTGGHPTDQQNALLRRMRMRHSWGNRENAHAASVRCARSAAPSASCMPPAAS